MANKISLNIGGFNLIINTQEDEAQVRKLNDILNEDLKQILTQNPSASITNAALLCALDYLDRYEEEGYNRSISITVSSYGSNHLGYILYKTRRDERRIIASIGYCICGL